MATISKKQLIINKLAAANAVSKLDDVRARQDREKFNDQVKKVTRDFQKKERLSLISAGHLTLTA